MQMLSEFFGGRVTSRNLRPSRSPGSIAAGFLSLAVFEGERVQKKVLITGIETKY
jgi:hypothetical protein